jgi:hypothetical protein
MNAEIRDQIVREGKRSSTDVHVYLEAVRTIGETMETMNFLRKGRTDFFPIAGSSLKQPILTKSTRSQVATSRGESGS